VQTARVTYELSGTGIWNAALRYGDPGAAAEAAAELESLGYSAIWLPDVGGDLFPALENVLGATTTTTVATGILNLWMHTPAETAEAYTRMTADHGRRLLVGIGVSHGPFIDMVKPGEYQKPLAKTEAYLDELDEQSPTVPADDRVLAALGPKMLALAGAKAAGTHPYNVVPEHTAAAREALGPGKLVAPEQAVVLETDPDKARAIARSFLATYLALPNYANNWFRYGLTPDDTLDGGTDRLVDALIAWGDEDEIAARVQAHRDAGADHVCIQVLTDDQVALTLDGWRRLAPVLCG
jgi:probable F420-dependent oxidoreductase